MGSTKKVAIVTGANTGIGRETALSLAKDGMKVFMTCRSADKGLDAASYIRESCPGADVEVILMDLKSLDSVRKCASEFKSRNQALDLLVNNAGATLGTSWYTAEGVGGSAQVNYLGPYVFTRLLEDSLVAGAPSRVFGFGHTRDQTLLQLSRAFVVVNVSSIMHRCTTLPDPEKFLRDFDAGQYRQSKLANVLFTFELQRRWQRKGIQACAVDPGASTWCRCLEAENIDGLWQTVASYEAIVNNIRGIGVPQIRFGAVASDIWRRSRFKKPPMSWAMKVAFAPTWDGAMPVIHAATTSLKRNEDKTPLRFFARGGFAWCAVTKPTFSPILALCAASLDWPIRYLSRGLFCNNVLEVPATPLAYDEKLASKLWDLSADIAGLPA